MKIKQKTDDEMLKAYERLHDGLSDMIESGRLTEADIPDDYEWLVQMLSIECQVEGGVEWIDG